MLNLLIALSPFILGLSVILWITVIEPILELIEHNAYSFSDVYNRCQHDIKCKQAHKAGMLAGEYYSDTYKAAYRAVLNGA